MIYYVTYVLNGKGFEMDICWNVKELRMTIADVMSFVADGYNVSQLCVKGYPMRKK